IDDAAARELTRLHHITTRVRLAGGVRLRGIVAAGENLPRARVEATLEEAYLAEIAPRERRAAGSFAVVYAAGERQAASGLQHFPPCAQEGQRECRRVCRPPAACAP